MQRETLRVEEVCALLDCSATFARVHAAKMGGRQIGSKTLFPIRPFCEATGFDEEDIREQVRMADDRGAEIRARAAAHMARTAESE